MERLAAIIVRRRIAAVVAALSFVVGVALIGLLGEADRDPAVTDTRPVGYDSTRVAELEQELPQGEGSTAIVLFTATSGTLSRAQLTALEPVYRDLLTAANRTPDGPEPAPETPGLLPSEDGTAAIGVIPVAELDAAGNEEVVARLRTAARDAVPEEVQAQVTGPAAIQADLASVFDGANLRLLVATASVVAVLLIITYRSPVLWLVPLICVAVADRVATVLASHSLAVTGIPWDESTTGIISVLVFGAGTDYSLLLISRYRDELHGHQDRYAAMRTALARTAEAVLSSAVTVVIGLLTLLLSAFPSTRGLGLGCAVGILVAAGYALVVLPATLVLFGRWIFWPLVPHADGTRLVDGRGGWRRVGEMVARGPAQVAAVTLVAIAIASLGLLSVRTGLSPSEQFLDTPEAITAADRLAESFPAGASDPTVVLTRDDPTRVAATAAEVPGVTSAIPTTRTADLARVDVVVDARAGSDEAQQTVRELRAALATHAETWVGGSEAASIDDDAAAARDQRLIIPLITGLVLVALVLLLRSLVAPLLLVATTVTTFFAGLGIAWVLYTQVFGFERMDVGVPLLAFLFLVALGVDYNIFLVSRAAEETPAHGTRAGMLRALTATGGVITSAGILLAAVFAVLGVLPLVVLAQLGIVICVGVLLDTLVVRTVLVPALAMLLGDRFWWPRKLG